VWFWSEFLFLINGFLSPSIVTLICLTFFVPCSFHVYVQPYIIRRHMNRFRYSKNGKDCIYPDCQCFKNSYKVHYSHRLRGISNFSHWLSFLINGVVCHTQNLWKRNKKKIKQSIDSISTNFKDIWCSVKRCHSNFLPSQMYDLFKDCNLIFHHLYTVVQPEVLS
jgi:hypothetical protein